MRKLTVFHSVTLDGVMQAPGRPDEDRRGDSPMAAGLVDAKPTITGVIIATYRPAGSAQDKEEQP
jgi:hypothetical protein